MKKRTAFSLSLGIASMLAAVATGASAANNEEKQVHTAAQHAGYAAEAGSLKMVHTHLHHAVNCLVGPDGAAFDKGFLNPCVGMGKGAIHDATNTKTKTSLNAALEAAKNGIAADDFKAAQEDAAQAAHKLEAASSAN